MMYAPLWSDADTIPHEYRELFLLDSLKLDYCPICGATWPLNQHHAVFRSAGECYDPRTGEPREKPTITLCGSGNASGCHGKAHHRMLHFKNMFGDWWYLETEEPTKYMDALKMDGWKPVMPRPRYVPSKVAGRMVEVPY